MLASGYKQDDSKMLTSLILGKKKERKKKPQSKTSLRQGFETGSYDPQQILCLSPNDSIFQDVGATEFRRLLLVEMHAIY